VIKKGKKGKKERKKHEKIIKNNNNTLWMTNVIYSILGIGEQ
jgi:hypothetical protein